MSNTVISVENVSKQYHLGTIGTGTFRNDLKLWWAKARNKPNPLALVDEADHGNRDGETLWALKDVSFKVEQGEALGIIGRNGAGKSTLLKILSRVTTPTSGEVKVKGRIASLLEVGTGFHPELTGRENIFLNGAIMGMSRAEVARKFDEIVDFSGVEKFIDTPVKRYSSGMYVRLAFAVAAHLEPEILIVDEVLAVGDAEFQKKCLGKMGDVSHEGRTVLFVSHNMGSIKALCTRGLYLEKGIIKFNGEIKHCVSKYNFNIDNECPIVKWQSEQAPSTNSAQILEVRIKNEGKEPSIDLLTELPILIEIIFEVKKKSKIGTSVLLYNSEGLLIFSSMSNHEPDWHMKIRPPGIYTNTCEIPSNLLADGRYAISIPFYEGFYESGIVERDVIQFNAHENGFVRGDLPYPQSGHLIQPLLRWKSSKNS